MEQHKENVTLNDLKVRELQILKTIDSFCMKNCIQYSLYYGTMLGAVRHKGFIPWDDDIDIAMPRKDYARFINTFSHEHYILRCIEKDTDWPFLYAKCMDMDIIVDEHIHNTKPFGAFVDIFPLDGLPEGNRKIHRIYGKQQILFFIISLGISNSRYTQSRNIIKKTLKYLLIPIFWISRQKLLQYTAGFIRKFDYDNSTMVGTLSIGTYGIRNVMEKKRLSEYIRIPFEDGFFMCFSGYDYYLSSIYGNYMELPPVEKRISHHTHDLHWNNKVNG